jgi:hypothetical protein
VHYFKSTTFDLIRKTNFPINSAVKVLALMVRNYNNFALPPPEPGEHPLGRCFPSLMQLRAALSPRRRRRVAFSFSAPRYHDDAQLSTK